MLAAAAIAALCAAAILLWIRRVRAARAARRWRALSPRLELALDPSSRGSRLSGRALARKVTVALARSGGAEVRGAIQAPLPPGLRLAPQLGKSRLQLRGVQDLIVGSEPFDSEVIVQGANPAGVLRLLQSAEVRDEVRALFRAHPDSQIASGEVSVRLPPGAGEAEIRAALKDAAGAARAIEEGAVDLSLEVARAKQSARQESVGPARRFTPLDPDFVFQRRIIRSFAARKATFKAFGVAPAFGGFLVYSWARPLSELLGRTLGALQELGILLFIGGFIAGAAVVAFVYRCPSCHQIPTDGGAVDLDAYACAHCGARLR